MLSKWYNYYLNKVEEIMKQYPRAWISTKEKYGRFDITYHSVPPSVQVELDDMENESVDRCQDCAKLRKQIWFEHHGWIHHACFRCYLLHLPSIIAQGVRRLRRRLCRTKQ